MKINMTLRGIAVLEGVTASIVVTFIYPGSTSHSPCDSICGAGLRWAREGLLVRTESNINNVFTKLQIREKQWVYQALFKQLSVGDLYEIFIIKL